MTSNHLSSFASSEVYLTPPQLLYYQLCLNHIKTKGIKHATCRTQYSPLSVRGATLHLLQTQEILFRVPLDTKGSFLLQLITIKINSVTCHFRGGDRCQDLSTVRHPLCESDILLLLGVQLAACLSW